MGTLRVPSLQSLLESDRGSNDSLLAESLQLDIEELDDAEYSIPAVEMMPTLESVLSELDGDSDIISDGGLTSTPTPSPSIDERQKTCTILRHVILQGVSSQVASAADRISSGLATAVAVSDMIAVGTSHGFILAFDVMQTLRWCCKEHAAQGAVSSLAFNEENSRLLAGFARGCIIMIDTASGDTIRTLSNIITPFSGVLNLKWTGKAALALCSDTGGSVWTLSFTRRLGMRGCDSRCFFSGARGEVCAVEPLVIAEDEHPMKAYCIVALATLSKFFVVMIRPRLKVVKFHALTGPSDSLPLLSWQMVLIQSADSSRVVDPVLAAARGNCVYFHQLSMLSGKISLLFLRHINRSYNLLAVHWLGAKTIATIDTTEMLHLTDVRSAKELECIDIAGAGLVYGSAHFKGFATGGNVSRALALAGTYACYNSVISRNSQLYILGARSLHCITMRSWSDRIHFLVQNQKWTEACALVIEGYKSAGDRSRRRQIAKDRTIRLVEEYLVATERFPELCLSSIMACLIEVGEYDFLWQELWDRLSQQDQYLVLLTEHIENGSIRFLSPIIAQALCEYWLKTFPKKLEDIILKLDWKCLDLHQVLTAAKKEKLFNAQMHLNTSALGDYCISLTELIPQIENGSNQNLGNYILVYVSSCLSGRGYPSGDIESDIIPQVKHEVLRCLTSIHSSHAPESELPYPYLRTLLRFDTRETINVISLAFQEQEFAGELGQSHRQRIVNILLDIMVPEHFPWTDIGCLLNFIAQQISTRSLPDDQQLLVKVVNYLKMETIENESGRQHSERELSWLELLETDTINYISLGDMLQMARQAKCYRVTQHILEKRKSYGEILNCYLMDSYRHSEMWSYIQRYADKPERRIYQQVYENFIKLLEIDSDETTKIVTEYFCDSIDQLVRLLDNNNQSLYKFVMNLLKHNIPLDSNDCETYLNLLCQYNPENVEVFLRNNENYRLENALEIVKKYQLYESMTFLYEKQGDFDSAFNLSLDLLREAPESTAEIQALELSALCSRASQLLPESERERLWFTFIKMILSRSDLTLITRSILHAASGHVDLTNLVQLVLNSGTKTGNFGDIKHLIVGMLANSKYETLLLETTSRILGRDLHDLLAKEKTSANHGVSIKSIKCIICRMRLHQQQDVVVLGACGHAAHHACLPELASTSDDNKIQCPRCGAIVNEKQSLQLSIPDYHLFDDGKYAERKSDILQVGAPPIIGGQ